MTLSQKASVRDSQTIPFVMIPKVFFTRFKPSSDEIAAYNALKYFAANRTGTIEFTSVPTMATLAGLSIRTFQRVVAKLARKGAVRVRQRTRKTPNGQRLSLPNLYEIMDLDLPGANDALI